jgi:endogenous inhibitor of DNA gyrase (YacG/DUF329 family)
MIRGKCPICGKRFEAKSLGDWPSFPFCAERCRLVDLGRWIDGAYAIPAGPQLDSDSDQSDGVAEDDDGDD